MISLREDAKKSPIFHAVNIWLFGVALLSLPASKVFEIIFKSEFVAYNLGGAIYRLLLCVVGIFLIYKYGFFKVIFSKISIRNLIFVIPFFLVVINNFPIVGAVTGRVDFYRSAFENFCYVLYCFSVGAVEQILFLGLIFPLFTVCFKDKKHILFLSVLLTATAFGLSHVINLFGGASFGAVIMQVGYSFLIGSACAISLAITKNLIVTILLHFIYDFGGLILGVNGIARGVQWDNITVIITIILGVIVTVYAVIICIKFDDKKIENLYR